MAKKGGVLTVLTPTPPTPTKVMIVGKRQPRTADTSIRARFEKAIEEEAKFANPEAPGPNSMRRLTESSRDREAFFLWAFQQNPEMLILLSRFLCYGWRSNDAMAHITGLIRDAANLAKFSSAEGRLEFMRRQFYEPAK